MVDDAKINTPFPEYKLEVELGSLPSVVYRISACSNAGLLSLMFTFKVV